MLTPLASPQPATASQAGLPQVLHTLFLPGTAELHLPSAQSLSALGSGQGRSSSSFHFPFGFLNGLPPLAFPFSRVLSKACQVSHAHGRWQFNCLYRRLGVWDLKGVGLGISKDWDQSMSLCCLHPRRTYFGSAQDLSDYSGLVSSSGKDSSPDRATCMCSHSVTPLRRVFAQVDTGQNAKEPPRLAWVAMRVRGWAVSSHHKC